jgi:hypothetical protein
VDAGERPFLADSSRSAIDILRQLAGMKLPVSGQGRRPGLDPERSLDSSNEVPRS